MESKSVREKLRIRLSLAEILVAVLLVVMLLETVIPNMLANVEISRETARERTDGEALYEALVEAYEAAYDEAMRTGTGASEVLEVRLKQRHEEFEFVEPGITLGGYEFSLSVPDGEGRKLPTGAGIENGTVYVQVFDLTILPNEDAEFYISIREGVEEGGYSGIIYAGPDAETADADGEAVSDSVS